MKDLVKEGGFELVLPEGKVPKSAEIGSGIRYLCLRMTSNGNRGAHPGSADAIFDERIEENLIDYDPTEGESLLRDCLHSKKRS